MTQQRHRCARLAACGGAIALATTAWAQSQIEFRVYDVSDLLPVEVRTMPTALSAQAHKEPTFTGAAPTTLNPADIANDIAMTMALTANPIGPWLIGVYAEPTQHDAFAAAIDAIHATYLQRVGVRVAVYAVGADQTPMPGARADAGGWGQPVREVSGVIRRRVPTRMASVTTRYYAEDVNVIVGTGGFGYEPKIAPIIEGLDLVVRVDAAGAGGASPVEAVGDLSRVAMRDLEMKGIINTVVVPGSNGVGEAHGPFELPTVDLRPIRSVISARTGAETVLAVVDDPGSGQRLVVTVRIAAAD